MDRRRGVVDEPLKRRLGRRAEQGVDVIDDEQRGVSGPTLEGVGTVLDGLPVARQAGHAGHEGCLNVAQQGRIPRSPTPRPGTTRPAGARAASLVSSVVLPDPAGAVMTARRLCQTASSRASSRSTGIDGVFGMRSLLATTGPGHGTQSLRSVAGGYPLLADRDRIVGGTPP